MHVAAALHGGFHVPNRLQVLQVYAWTALQLCFAYDRHHGASQVAILAASCRAGLSE